MLRYLKIKNLAIIDEAELHLDQGFICLTGESGAGKSVLIDALLLLGGGRADTSLVRSGCAKAVVEAEFELAETNTELDLLEGPTLLLRREISAEGKSRAFVNGVMVPNNLLANYGELAFEIHGQHGQQRLLKEKNHLAIFDIQTGLATQAAAFESDLAVFRKAFNQYWELKQGEAQRLREMDFLNMQIGEIEAVKIVPADRDLEMRIKKARNREAIAAKREEMRHLLEDRLVPGTRRLLALTGELSVFDDALTPYVEQVASLEAVLQDLEGETHGAVGFFPEDDLGEMEARESALNTLYMKYGRNLDEVQAELGRLKDQLHQLQSAAFSLDDRWQELEKSYRQLGQKQMRLHRARAAKCEAFGKKVVRSLRQLALPGALFQAQLAWPAYPAALPAGSQLSLSAASCRFLLSANPGEPPKALAKIASGGELSRLLLALISAFERPAAKLLVFDEIDAGLGGETAHAVGGKLAELGQHHQVLCVTHFAQVARFANQQIKIEKGEKEGRAVTRLAVCDYEQRIAELARLMGGDANAENLRDHARQLIAGVS